MRFAAIGLLICALAGTVAASSNHDELVVSLESVRKGGVSISIENVSGQRVPVTQIDLGGEVYSGVSLFLYDPVNKKLQQAFSTSFPAHGNRKKSIRILEPGAVVERVFAKDDIENYFFYMPDCYYLVALYRRRDGSSIISSAASNTLKVCD